MVCSYRTAYFRDRLMLYLYGYKTINGGVGMEVVIKPIHSLPCRLEVFTINGKDANQDDFGDMSDHHAESAEPYACADMHFDRKPSTKEVLDKYNITEEEYYNICNELEDKLCIGGCGWCV